MMLAKKIFVSDEIGALKLLITTIPLTFLAIVIGDYALYGCIGLVIILFSYLYGERFIIPFIIISLFTLVGDFNRQLRLFIQLLDFSLVGVLFLKRFGLQWNKYPKVPKVILYFLLLFYSSMVISSALSNYPLAGIVSVFRQSVFFIIAYMFYALIKDESDVKLYFISIIIATCVLAGSTIVSFYMEGSSFIEMELGLRSRVSGLITNPNKLTNFYMISFPLIIIALLFTKQFSHKMMLWFLLLFFCAGLILTISRTAILGVVISMLTIFFIFKKKYFYRSLIAIIALVIVILIYEPFGNFSSLLFRIGRGLAGREHIWAISIDMIKDNPIFGVGVGSFKYEMFNYVPVMLGSWAGQELVNLHTITGSGTNLAHNFLIGFYTDMGVLGLTTALSLTFLFFSIGFKTVKSYKHENIETYRFLVALFVSGATMFFRGLVDNVGLLSYGVISSDLPFWLIFGSIIFYHTRINKK